MNKKLLIALLVTAAVLLAPADSAGENGPLEPLPKAAVEAPLPAVTVTLEQLLPGTADQTALYVIEAAVAGPAVLVIGGIHGDEPAGSLAAALIATWQIDRGTLLVLPQANPRALAAGSRCAPGAGDLNRAFPGAAAGSSCRQLAGAIFGIMEQYQPDWVLDLHEAAGFEKTDPGALGQTIIYPRRAPSLKTAAAVLERVNAMSAPFQDHFLLLRGQIKGGTIHTAVNLLGLDGFLVETCRKNPLEQRVREHTRVVAALLEQLGITVY